MIALAVVEKEPREAMTWITTIGDDAERGRMVGQASRLLAARDPVQARQWIETAPVSAELKALFLSNLERIRSSVSP